MRICNWCTRECFHDGGANELNDVAYVIGTNTGEVVTAPPGYGGFDSSVMLNISEQLRDENRYDSFSTFVAATIRTLVGFYDISYSDGLAVCGAVAREMLSYGTVQAYTLMPAIDPSFPVESERRQPFRVGRLDSKVANGAGILPGPTLTTQGAADWANKHLARGIYDLLALLGSHATLDNKHCVKNNDTSGPFAKKQRMFSWNAPTTYYTELATSKLEAPIPDMESEKFYRVDPPQHPLIIAEQERCKFTSKPFQNAAVTSVQAALANPNSPPSDPEPSFEWIDESLQLDDNMPGDVVGRRRLAQAVEAVDPPRAPRPKGYRTRRTCDYDGMCYDGWPYTQNDGYMGQTAQKNITADGLEADVYNAVTAFQKPDTFHAAYGHAFIRILNNGATFVKVKGNSGMSITGWECKTWVSGDGSDKGKNRYCQTNCFVQKDDGKGKPLGCPKQLAEPYLSKVISSNYNCRCQTAPWGQKATQLLTPNSTQSIVGGVIATPSGVTGLRKLLAWQPAHGHHAAANPHAGNGGSGDGAGSKARCPFEAQLRLGGFA